MVHFLRFLPFLLLAVAGVPVGNMYQFTSEAGDIVFGLTYFLQPSLMFCLGLFVLTASKWEQKWKLAVVLPAGIMMYSAFFVMSFNGAFWVIVPACGFAGAMVMRYLFGWACGKHNLLDWTRGKSMGGLLKVGIVGAISGLVGAVSFFLLVTLVEPESVSWPLGLGSIIVLWQATCGPMILHSLGKEQKHSEATNDRLSNTL